MTNLAIIQARMGSTRLPGKVLKKICGKTVIQHVVDRVERSRTVDKVFVATTHKVDDLVLVKECINAGYNIFCGSEHDVLDRYYQLAKLEKPDNIIRITSDCPVIDPAIIDLVVSEHLDNKADYTCNTMVTPFPDGQDVEVFSFDALEEAWNNSTLKSDREHVTPYIKFNKGNFKLHFIESTEELSSFRLTLDEESDVELLEILFDSLYKHNPYFGLEDILDFLQKNPQVKKINATLIREAGYRKSLKEDELNHAI